MLRPATDGDVETIRRWRNHPKVRRASFTTHEIGPEEHRAWWEAVSADPTKRVLIFERNGTPGVSVVLYRTTACDGECWRASLPWLMTWCPLTR